MGRLSRRTFEKLFTETVDVLALSEESKKALRDHLEMKFACELLHYERQVEKNRERMRAVREGDPGVAESERRRARDGMRLMRAAPSRGQWSPAQT